MSISETRKELLTGTTFQRIVFPEVVELRWDPTNISKGSLRWNFKEWLVVDGAASGKESNLTGHTNREFSAVKNVQPAYAGTVDPVTGADLTQISLHGVFLILNDAFDRAYEQDATA